jgi:hypothetical protein
MTEGWMGGGRLAAVIVALGLVGSAMLVLPG